MTDKTPKELVFSGEISFKINMNKVLYDLLELELTEKEEKKKEKNIIIENRINANSKQVKSKRRKK